MQTIIIEYLPKFGSVGPEQHKIKLVWLKCNDKNSIHHLGMVMLRTDGNDTREEKGNPREYGR